MTRTLDTIVARGYKYIVDIPVDGFDDGIVRNQLWAVDNVLPGDFRYWTVEECITSPETTIGGRFIRMA